jgi:hypothetical protein
MLPEGLDGCSVAHTTRLKCRQERVIFVMAPGSELDKRVDLSVGDMAAGQLTARPCWLIASATAFCDYCS